MDSTTPPEPKSQAKKKYKRPQCKHEGCPNQVKSRGLCKSHGGGIRCKVEGCDRPATKGGHCYTHGGKSCTVEGCDKTTQRKGLCYAHGGKPAEAKRCTITSHAPFDSVPRWYNESQKPDFSALYDGEEHAKEIKRYLEARYFTDTQLGKFLDRMQEEGILDNTIVVIYGDHGQAPEAEIIYTEEVSLTRVPALILAEGRLGKYAGLKIEDAAEHYDILNTLADITGLPEGGFVQNGVGRSLKRKVTFGERAVFSNVPGHKMSVVRGNYRLRYDGVTDAMFLHNTETDHWMNQDLLLELRPEKQAEWETWRENGRRISAYYTKRWDENCLLAVNCTEETYEEHA